MENEVKYYLGLDMGTSSLGWAVTDELYRLKRAKGKDLWGVRLFEEAETAADRRSHRISRRRRQREVARIGLLKEMFADEINKVDPGFLQRLDESKYFLEDKQVHTKYALFADRKFTDKEYYQTYPTIFHLRKELMESNEPHDVRLVYLALLNMFKHRGHFLNANLSADQSSDVDGNYTNLCELVKTTIEMNLPPQIEKGKLGEILSNQHFSRTRMSEEIAGLVGVSKTKEKDKYELIKSFCGLSFQLSKIFKEDTVPLENQSTKLCFTSSSFDEDLNQVRSYLSDDLIEIIETAKQLHDSGLLENIMRGYNYLSESRVASYEKHKKDLKILKAVIKKYARSSYKKMFRKMEEKNYSAYVGTTNSGKKVRRNVKQRDQGSLYKTIETILNEAPREDKEVDYIFNEIATETFLPKQLVGSNGVIPNQVHLNEMKKILENASIYLPFLNEIDETKLSIKQKIMDVFKFQIPYYVGPLSTQHKDKGGNAWLVRKPGKILPWNFEEMVDLKQSATNFIDRMVRHCTYLSGERVLPKSSLLYESYVLLNELNNLKIRGEKPSVELKQEIYNDLFLSGKKVTGKTLASYLHKIGVLEEGEESAISGIDKDFQSTLASHKKFADIFGMNFEKDQVKAMVEDIIYHGTIYGNDKKFYVDYIKETYKNEISDEQLKKISSFKFKDWGRLSKQFLLMEGENKTTGEINSLIRMMWDTNKNLMELLTDSFTFIDVIKEKTNDAEKTLSDIEFDDLNDMYLSAPVKRMLWQTLLVIKELESVLGCPPTKVFVEMTRSEGEKKRKDSRKSDLLKIYKTIKSEEKDWAKEIDVRSESDFRSKKLYLYYTQMGISMYSNKRIELDRLFDDNLYDIDHIYPQSKTKDNSLINNMVLCLKDENKAKSDSYPIKDQIYQTKHADWKALLDKGLISKEKYERLVCRKPFTDEQLTDFINRQIVETGQGTKAVAHLIEEVFPDSDVVYVKAGNVSDFRHDYDLLKSRSVNDLHHAQDAYLNIVVGNVYNVKFTNNPSLFIKEQKKETTPYNMKKLFTYNVRRNDEVAWVAPDQPEASIKTVLKTVDRTTPLITRMNYEAHGQITDATLYGASKVNDEAYIPLKSSDTRLSDMSKYGGFNKASIAYYFLVEHTYKKERIRTIEGLPIYVVKQIGESQEKLIDYCIKKLGLIDPSIRLPKIKIQSLIKVNGFYLTIAGKTGDRLSVRNAQPLLLSRKWINYIKKLEKVLEAEDKMSAIEKNNLTKSKLKINSTNNIELFTLLIEKHRNTIFSKRPNPTGEVLAGVISKFTTLNLADQTTVITQILQLTQLHNLTADLQLLDLPKKAGIMFISKKMSNFDEAILINQSPTGLFVSEIDLLKI